MTDDVTVDELPEEEIEAAEDVTADHAHEGLGEDTESLLAHLRSHHDLDAPAHLSSSTLHGLHDRLHDETAASDT